MTAAAGIVHEEFHGREFARRGGALRDGAALGQPAGAATRWRRRATRRIVDAADSRRSSSPDGAGRVRVIAGEFARREGPGEDVHADRTSGTCACRRRDADDARGARRLHDGARRAARRGARRTAPRPIARGGGRRSSIAPATRSSDRARTTTRRRCSSAASRSTSRSSATARS